MITFDSEASLEEFIIEHFKHDKVLGSLNIELQGNKFELRQQFHLGAFGRCDLVLFDKKEDEIKAVHIIELKNVEIDHDVFLQTSRYVAGMKQWLREQDLNDDIVNGIVIAPGTKNTESWAGLYCLLKNIDLYLFEFDVDGFDMTQIIKTYNLEEANLKFTSSRDPVTLWDCAEEHTNEG